MLHSGSHVVDTHGRGTYDISAAVQSIVRESGVRAGLCHVFIHHTSASLMLCENADPQVRADLERFFGDLVPDGDARFAHTSEGPDDMPAHIKAMMMPVTLSVPVLNGRMRLGTWQGIYVVEHRARPHRREVALHFIGTCMAP